MSVRDVIVDEVADVLAHNKVTNPARVARTIVATIVASIDMAALAEAVNPIVATTTAGEPLIRVHDKTELAARAVEHLFGEGAT